MSEPSLSLDETRHVANLSKLHYDETELQELSLDLSRILTIVAKLEKVPVEGLEATLAVGAYANRFRDDIVGTCLDRNLALSNAPAQNDGSFEIPRILSKRQGKD